jgi:hypothetical protein
LRAKPNVLDRDMAINPALNARGKKEKYEKAKNAGNHYPL